jgi:hypothetical protein
LLKDAEAWEPSTEADLKYVEYAISLPLQRDDDSGSAPSMDDMFKADDDSTVIEGSSQDEPTIIENNYSPEDIDDSPENLISFMTFLSAYAMRPFVKQSTNMDKSWLHMKNRFIGFFRDTDPVIRDIPLASWASLKTYLTSCRKYQG